MVKSTLAPFVLLAVLATPAFSAPTVDLLIDHGYASTGTLSLRSTLASVATRKGQTFHFGSTYDTYDSNQSWASNIFSTFFNHVVAENGCKWDATEPSEGVSSLTGCIGVQTFATSSGASFRGHNTFWHSQTPTWLPGSFSATELTGTIIPQHVQAEISGLGASVTSWDVVNEIVGDGVSSGMTAWECVKNKNDWPTQTSDGSGTSLVTDLTFVHVAFSTAYQYAGSSTRLSINDYNTGGNDAKTACVIAVLEDIQSSTSIPYDRLAIGFQSHISTSSFTAKSALSSTFSQLAALGVEAMITELDIAISAGTSDTADLRYQAAIWGDYIDACLYASNCNEFINWDPRDDESWLGTAEAGTLFDTSGNPKPAAYEVAARLAYYASGGAELCATALGTGSCTINVTGTGTTTGVGSTTSSVGSTTSSTVTTTSSAPGATQTEYGQCGGIGWTGATACSSGNTCQVLNSYYSQCLP